MGFFKTLLFLTPIICLIRVHWITPIMLLMLFSLTPSLIKNFNDKSLPPKKIIHPIASNILIFIIILISYQILSFCWFDFDQIYVKKAIKKIILLIFNILTGIGLLYALVNQPNAKEQNKNFDCLAKGLIFASVIFLLDHLLHHKIFSLIMPNMITNDNIGYNIYQSHMGQILCIIIIWPVIANLWITDCKKYSLFVFIMVGLIAITPFIFYKVNYNAPLSFIVGCVSFVIFSKIKKSAILIAIMGFIFMIAIVPIIFTIADTESNFFNPNIKLSINHRICIWHYYAYKIYNSLITGYGFNSSETFGAVENITCGGAFPNQNLPELMPLVANGHHPHNIGLQVLLELGIIGFIIIIILGSLIIYQLSIKQNIIIRKLTMTIINKQNIIKSAILASFFSFLAFLIAAVNIWAGWVVATIFLCSAICKMLILEHHNQ